MCTDIARLIPYLARMVNEVTKKEGYSVINVRHGRIWDADGVGDGSGGKAETNARENICDRFTLRVPIGEPFRLSIDVVASNIGAAPDVVLPENSTVRPVELAAKIRNIWDMTAPSSLIRVADAILESTQRDIRARALRMGSALFNQLWEIQLSHEPSVRLHLDEKTKEVRAFLPLGITTSPPPAPNLSTRVLRMLVGLQLCIHFPASDEATRRDAGSKVNKTPTLKIVPRAFRNVIPILRGLKVPKFDPNHLPTDVRDGIRRRILTALRTSALRFEARRALVTGLTQALGPPCDVDLDQYRYVHFYGHNTGGKRAVIILTKIPQTYPNPESLPSVSLCRIRAPRSRPWDMPTLGIHLNSLGTDVKTMNPQQHAQAIARAVREMVLRHVDEPASRTASAPHVPESVKVGVQEPRKPLASGATVSQDDTILPETQPLSDL